VTCVRTRGNNIHRRVFSPEGLFSRGFLSTFDWRQSALGQCHAGLSAGCVQAWRQRSPLPLITRQNRGQIIFTVCTHRHGGFVSGRFSRRGDYPASYRLWITETNDTLTLIAISRCATRMRQSHTSCRLIWSPVAVSGRAGTYFRLISAAAGGSRGGGGYKSRRRDTTVVVGENCFRCRHREGATAHLTYGTDVTRTAWIAHDSPPTV